jgi:hypothetical protein
LLPLHSSFSPVLEHSILAPPMNVEPLATASPAAFRQMYDDPSQGRLAEPVRSDCSM